ncbi:MAG: DUF4143 domain-containing protein [Syntrophales bacterium]|nr:DUF4143 domain-containing protein [Syntrophales bacterium]
MKRRTWPTVCTISAGGRTTSSRRRAKQIVGQEMLIFQQDELYYWDRYAKSSSAEVDFLAVVDGMIQPVEVKSGAWGA